MLRWTLTLGVGRGADYFERLKCSRRVFGLNTGAWNNGTRFGPSFIGFVGLNNG